MRFCSLLIAFFSALVFGAPAAHATVDIAIDLSSQHMDVTSSSGSYSWPISSGRAGYLTPTGIFHSQAMYRLVYSKAYGNAPMPHAIFFTGGYAIHGTAATGALGSPASHGCIRLSPGNAAALYQMVKAEGAHITISGAAPVTQVASHADRRATRQVAAAHGKHHHYAHAGHGKGTKYAGGATKRHHLASRSNTAPTPSPQSPAQDMLGLFGGGF